MRLVLDITRTGDGRSKGRPVIPGTASREQLVNSQPYGLAINPRTRTVYLTNLFQTGSRTILRATRHCRSGLTPGASRPPAPADASDPKTPVRTTRPAFLN
jgi:hypothetical protein